MCFHFFHYFLVFAKARGVGLWRFENYLLCNIFVQKDINIMQAFLIYFVSISQNDIRYLWC